MTKLFLPILASFFSDFLPAPTGFGSAGIRKHRQCGAIIIVGDFPGQYGVETDEDGISVDSFEVVYKPFVNDRLMSNVGEPRARAISDKFSRDLTIGGEVTGASGVMAFTLATACAFANDSDTFGDGSGDFLLDEVTEKQGRAAWRRIDMKCSSDPGVTV
jgi:hypothetical protein